MQLNHHRTGSGEPLVLIHGIGSRWQMWAPVMDELARHHDVIALDMPGFGVSPMPPPGTPPGAGSLATLVAGFLEELGVARPHLAGNSLGGLVVLELARRRQARSVTGLSPAGFANRPETLMAQTSLRMGVAVARMLGPRVDRAMRRPGLRRLAFGQVVAHPERIAPLDAAESVHALADAPWFDETLPAIGPLNFGEDERIDVPVTIAWGEKDRLLLPRQAARAARAIPTARIVSLRDCGHVPTYDDPAQVAQVLLQTTGDRT